MSAARPPKKRLKDVEATQPDAIQPCGWLIVCNAQATRVLRHSANLGRLFPDHAEPFVGGSVSELLGSETAHGLRNALARFIGPTRPALFLDRRLAGRDGAFDISTCRASDEILIEIEQAPSQSDRDGLDRLRAMNDRIAQATDAEKLLATAARLIFSVLQYDRVSILRFEDDGSTRVLAQQTSVDLELEDRAADLTGTPRPRLDGPRFRFIADHDAPPTLILGEQDGVSRRLDLTWSCLRAADGDERQSLRRGGFVASLSLTLMVDGALWGLILCQDRAPRHPSMSVRAVTELFGDFLSLQLATLLQKQTLAKFMQPDRSTS